MGRRSNNGGRGLPPDPPAPPGAGKRTPAIDLFIDRGLHQLYDGIMDEDVPEHLLRLIEGDREK